MVFLTDFHGFSMASMDFQSFSLGWTHDHRTSNGHCGHLSGCWASVISHWWDTFIRSQICKKNIFISLRLSRRPFLGLRCAALPPPAPHECSDISTSGRYALTAAPFYSPSARSRNSIASSMARSTTKSSSSNSSKPTANSQANKHSSTGGTQGGIEPETSWIWWFWWSWCLCLCLWWGEGGGF